MDVEGILYGLGVLGVAGAAWAAWRYEQRVKARTGATASPDDLAVHVQAAVAAAVEAIPRQVSDEVKRLEADGQALLARAQTAEAAFVSEHAASIARAGAIGAAVAKAMTELGEMTAEEAAALAAQFQPDLERIKTVMSQAGDELVATINGLKDRVAQLAAAGSTADAEKADHEADLTNISGAVQNLAAALPTPAEQPQS